MPRRVESRWQNLSGVLGFFEGGFFHVLKRGVEKVAQRLRIPGFVKLRISRLDERVVEEGIYAKDGCLFGHQRLGC